MQQVPIQQQLRNVSFVYQIIKILKENELALFKDSDLTDAIILLSNKYREARRKNSSHDIKQIESFCASPRLQKIIDQLIIDLPNLEPKHLSLIAFSCHTLKVDSKKAEPLARALALQAQKNISSFSPKELLNLTNAFLHVLSRARTIS